MYILDVTTIPEKYWGEWHSALQVINPHLHPTRPHYTRHLLVTPKKVCYVTLERSAQLQREYNITVNDVSLADVKALVIQILIQNNI